MDNTKHIERAKYMIKNKLNIAEAAAILKLDASTIRKSLQLAGGNWKKKVDSMIAWKKIQFRAVPSTSIIDKINSSETIHEQRVKYMINNPKIKIYDDAAGKLKLTRFQIGYSVRVVRKDNPVLYTKLQSCLQERKEIRSKIVNHILNYPNSTRSSVAKKFKCSATYVSTSLAEARSESNELYSIAKEIITRNKTVKYVEYAKYIIKNKSDIESTATHFKTTKNAIKSSFFTLKIHHADLYNQVKNII